jgi:hypothetical protein
MAEFDLSEAQIVTDYHKACLQPRDFAFAAENWDMTANDVRRERDLALARLETRVGPAAGG